MVPPSPDTVKIADTIKIADTVNRWEFRHMGQFAADYRPSFSELPSAMLRRP